MICLRILFVFTLMNGTLAQGGDRDNLCARFTGDAHSAVLGSYHVITAPYHWNSADWIYFGVIASSAVGSYFLDHDIRQLFQRNKGRFADNLSRFGEIYGEPLTVIALTGGIYAYGLFLNNLQARRIAILMTAALIPAGTIQTISKIAAGRARPLTDEGHNTFKPFSRTEDFYSFVSGHTLVAMTISLVLAKQFRSVPVKIAVHSLGVIGGISRIYNDDHWFSDVLLGGALSYACVYSADNWINQNTETLDNKNISILFHVTSTKISISFLW